MQHPLSGYCNMYQLSILERHERINDFEEPDNPSNTTPGNRLISIDDNNKIVQNYVIGIEFCYAILLHQRK
jgi:hypothetical protein